MKKKNKYFFTFIFETQLFCTVSIYFCAGSWSLFDVLHFEIAFTIVLPYGPGYCALKRISNCSVMSLKAFKIACWCLFPLNCNDGIQIPVEFMFLVAKNWKLQQGANRQHCNWDFMDKIEIRFNTKFSQPYWAYLQKVS